MAKPEWGVKRICPNCGARYYDMRKEPPVCPACGTQFDPEALLKSRRARPSQADEGKKAPASRKAAVAAVAEVADPIELEEVAEEELDDDGVVGPAVDVEVDDDDDDDVLEDTSDLGDDDMDEVVDVATGGDDDDR